MKSTPRMRRYVSGLRKLIRINQGPKMLLRPSSKVFGSSDGFEGDTGDAFDAHQWKCVRIIIRHRNIVKLLCCISNNDTMLLVYEYVENQSLDRWLHKKIDMKSSNVLSSLVHHVTLDWTNRMHITIGVAQGLNYMHHECSPPVVHRDVKTSKILLDAQFNAKVDDFGLARMFDTAW